MFASTVISEYNRFISIQAAVALILSVALVIFGIRLLQAPGFTARHERNWRTILGVVDRDPQPLRPLFMAFAHISAWRTIFTGLAILVVEGAWVLLWIVTNGAPRILAIFNGYTLILLLLVGGFVAQGVGQAYALRRLRTQTSHLPAFADLQPRQLAQTRPVWLGIALVAMIVGCAVAGAVALPSVGTMLAMPLAGGGMLTVAAGPIWLFVIPLVMLGIDLLGEWLMRWIVALPRLRLAEGLPDAPAIEDRFRRETIAAFQMQIVMAQLFLAIEQFVFLDQILAMGAARTAIDLVRLLLAISYLLILVLTIRHFRQMPHRPRTAIGTIRQE